MIVKKKKKKTALYSDSLRNELPSGKVLCGEEKEKEKKKNWCFFCVCAITSS